MQSLHAVSNPPVAALAAALLLSLACPAHAAWVNVGSVSTPGQTAYIQNAAPNDAILFVNGSDTARGQRTVLNATLVHDGYLLNAAYGLDHMVVSVRGSSAGRLFSRLGLSASTPSYFGYGEHLGANHGPAAAGTALGEALYGRGPTFWPAGSPRCRDSRYACMLFENYTIQVSTAVNLCDGLICGYDVPLPLTSAAFQVSVTADDWDMIATVSQNGTVIANVSCRALTYNDARCGAQSTDIGHIDAFIANVVNDGNPGSSGRRLGATNVTVRVQRENTNL